MCVSLLYCVLFAHVLSLGVCFCDVWDCSSCLGDSGDPHQVVVVGTTL